MLECTLQTALVELVLNLGDCIALATIADHLGESRNKIAKMVSCYRKGKDSEKDIKWTVPMLQHLAEWVNVPLSSVIKAAEDVVEGYPPWFEIRINRKTKNRERRIAYILMEALNCPHYETLIPHEEGHRRSRCTRIKDTPTPETVAALFVFASIMCDNLKDTALFMAYTEGRCSDKAVYCMFRHALKAAVGDLDAKPAQVLHMTLVDKHKEFSRLVRLHKP